MAVIYSNPRRYCLPSTASGGLPRHKGRFYSMRFTGPTNGGGGRERRGKKGMRSVLGAGSIGPKEEEQEAIHSPPVSPIPI